jgi:hypothetical protein
MRAGSVVGWVTTSESPVLYVFLFLPPLFVALVGFGWQVELYTNVNAFQAGCLRYVLIPHLFSVDSPLTT